MVKKSSAVLRGFGKLLSIFWIITACSNVPPVLQSQPRQEINRLTLLQPQMVESTWRFETVSSPRRFQFRGQDWLAIDSTGRPAMAYGGSQLNYAWFDGTTWQVQIIDPRPGSGKYAHLLFDANDQPHIIYVTGGVDNPGLDAMYRDSQGWHHETVEPDFFHGGRFDAILDGQGNLVVAYEVTPRVPSPIYTGPQTRVAYRAENNWQISIITEQGSAPSLAIDREKHLHLGYWNSAALLDMLHQGDGTWQEQNHIEAGTYPQVSDLMIDTNLRPHFVYCFSQGDVCRAYHSWLDENGWQLEEVGPIADLSLAPAVLMDSKDRIYLLGAAGWPKILRRDANGWRELHTLDEERTYYPGLSLTLDQDEQIHAAYFKLPEYAIHYTTEQDGVWRNNGADQGNEPFISFGVQAAMVYDRQGQLHIAHYDVQHNVHYLSKEKSGWHDEVVAQIRYRTNPDSIELIFDLQDRPHIFYQDHRPLVSPSSFQLKHAFQANGSWVSEDVPYDPTDHGYERSPILLNPQGRPAFAEAQYDLVRLRYRAADGWKEDLLRDIHARGELKPELTFRKAAPSSSSSHNDTLTNIFYADADSHALKLAVPGQQPQLVVPILGEKEWADRIAMRQLDSGSAVFLITSNAGNFFRYALHEKDTWQV